MDNKKQERKSGERYKVIFRLDGKTAKQLDSKLEKLGLKKQTFFEKIVNQFLRDEITIDSKSDNIISTEEIESVVKNVIASDDKLLSGLTERVKNLVLEDLKENPDLFNLLSFDSKLITSVADNIHNKSLPEEFVKLKKGAYSCEFISKFFLNEKGKKVASTTIGRWLRKAVKCPYPSIFNYLDISLSNDGRKIKSIKKIK